MIDMILTLFCVFSVGNTTPYPIPTSNITPNPTVSTPYPSILVSSSIPNSTYSTPHRATDSMPNDIFKRIRTDTMFVWTAITRASSNMDNTFGYFDICNYIS